MMSLPRPEKNDWLIVLRLKTKEPGAIVDDFKKAGFNVTYVAQMYTFVRFIREERERIVETMAKEAHELAKRFGIKISSNNKRDNSGFSFAFQIKVFGKVHIDMFGSKILHPHSLCYSLDKEPQGKKIPDNRGTQLLGR